MEVKCDLTSLVYYTGIVGIGIEHFRHINTVNPNQQSVNSRFEEIRNFLGTRQKNRHLMNIKDTPLTRKRIV